ncbi:MAG TPA: hypothetical protein VK689_15085, partial [Armatimonadota bacterium]|nr:hypothetical protein [Armatimonadota bacterium]
MMTGTLRQFAAISDAIRASSGKLEKTRLLGEFFRSLPDDDLYWAAVYFTGSAFARSSGKVVQVGFAALQAATLAVTGATAEAFEAEYLRWSDVGDTVATLYGERDPGRNLSLSEIAGWFQRLAETPAGTAKAVVVTQLFTELNADEARYVAKILTGDLRIGLKEGLVEDAIAAAFAVKPAELRKAHQLAGDIGRVATAARAGTLESLQVQLFSPVKPMLAT